MADEQEKDLFKRAAEIASVVPESMQDAAFRRALDRLEGEKTPPKREAKRDRTKPRRRGGGDSKPGDADSAAIVLSQINRTEHPEVSKADKALERSLHVLKIARDEFQVDGLTAPQIAEVLTEKFRLRTTRQRVSQVLDGASTLVDRVAGSGRAAARYRIMAPGEKHLENGGGESSKPKDSKTAAKSRAQSGRTRPSPKKVPETKSKKPGKSSGKRSSRTVGPRAALEGLVADGYLDQPRTIGQMRERLDHKKGLAFKVTDLSPALTRMLRNEDVDREKNDSGQYEYKRK